MSTGPSRFRSGKRLGVRKCEDMGDWFAGWSPRNGDWETAEGPWDHWVDLALMILQHPATQVVRPDAYKAVQGIPTFNFYTETKHALSDAELASLFGEELER